MGSLELKRSFLNLLGVQLFDNFGLVPSNPDLGPLNSKMLTFTVFHNQTIFLGTSNFNLLLDSSQKFEDNAFLLLTSE